METPLRQQIRSWLADAFAGAGADLRMGLSAFRDAGLPEPEMTMEAVAGGGSRSAAFGWSNIVQGIVPPMKRLGIATAEDVAPDTLTERLLADAEEHNAIVVGPCLYGAWVTE
ncbi:hypothetical protein SAMN05216215_1004230 [Saccharopolyspora shandongensis]|uniref:Uncharacterized protein n=1 Tax=Saccharopolyspora shandongensis TaxID=418495 RepID=A0A1H2V7T5_9PSEU|nr:hypothetical protein [Saccharopolyspora shandongensis]SDW64396.1 hypothetical protein SAMN05216215_1004230 [Saccharopolyspora shandongensis]